MANLCNTLLATYVFANLVFLTKVWCTDFQETLHKHKQETKDDQTSEYLTSHLTDSEESVKQHSSSTTKRVLFKNWPLMSSIILFCLTSYDDMAYTEVCLPILLKTLRIFYC